MKQLLLLGMAMLCLLSCKKENYEIPSMSCGDGNPIDNIHEFKMALDGKWRLTASFANGKGYELEDYDHEVYLEFDQDSVHFDSTRNKWIIACWDIEEENGSLISSERNSFEAFHIQDDFYAQKVNDVGGYEEAFYYCSDAFIRKNEDYESYFLYEKVP
jgi:hypothetical protein